MGGGGGGPRMAAPPSGGGQRFDGPRGGDGGGKWANDGWKGGKNRHRGGRRFYGGYPYYYAAPFAAYSYGYNGGGCGWLRRRAEETGSAYWWDRYEDCLDGY